MAIRGKVRGLGNRYSDGVEANEIHVPRQLAGSLPYKQGERVAVTLVIDGVPFEGGLRSTERCPYIWLCPDLRQKGSKVRLADVLASAGLDKNAEVEIQVEDARLTVERPLTQP